MFSSINVKEKWGFLLMFWEVKVQSVLNILRVALMSKILAPGALLSWLSLVQGCLPSEAWLYVYVYIYIHTYLSIYFCVCLSTLCCKWKLFSDWSVCIMWALSLSFPCWGCENRGWRQLHFVLISSPSYCVQGFKVWLLDRNYSCLSIRLGKRQHICLHNWNSNLFVCYT